MLVMLLLAIVSEMCIIFAYFLDYGGWMGGLLTMGFLF